MRTHRAGRSQLLRNRPQLSKVSLHEGWAAQEPRAHRLCRNFWLVEMGSPGRCGDTAFWVWQPDSRWLWVMAGRCRKVSESVWPHRGL